jgi:hypothetical protein
MLKIHLVCKQQKLLNIRSRTLKSLFSDSKMPGSALLVVAFDFGTTYSGYAFSFRNEPLKVQTNQGWVAGSDKLISLKTPTCVLLNPCGQFDSFGFEAEDKFAGLAEDNKHNGWLLFRRFKMILHRNEVNLITMSFKL